MSILPIKVRITCTGTRPLLMHNVQMASQLNEYVKAIAPIKSKQKKTEQDRLDMARIEFEGGMYFDEEIGPYIPSQNLFRSLVCGARLTRAGKKVERGLSMLGYMYKLEYQGPRTVDGLWGVGLQSPFVDIRPVTVQRDRIDRCRARFDKWAITAEALLDPTVLDFDELVAIADTAGAVEGLGDFRQMFGRYDAVVEQI